MQYYLSYFASTYGENAYNSSVYSAQSTTSGGGGTSGGSSGGSGTTSTSTGGGSSSSQGGVLTDTGFDVIAAVTLACAIIFVALIVRFWKRKPASNLENHL